MITQLEYKGFAGSVSYCDEDNIFFGKVLGLPSTLIMYDGETIEALKKDFMDAIDFHLLPDVSTETGLRYPERKHAV